MKKLLIITIRPLAEVTLPQERDCTEPQLS